MDEIIKNASDGRLVQMQITCQQKARFGTDSQLRRLAYSASATEISNELNRRRFGK
jgi:hypothetical protein